MTFLKECWIVIIELVISGLDAIYGLERVYGAFPLHGYYICMGIRYSLLDMVVLYFYKYKTD